MTAGVSTDFKKGGGDMLETEQKKRLKKAVLRFGTVLIIGLAYLVFVRLTGLGIPCLLTLFTKGYCPGCGITRMFLALSRLDFAAAVRANVLVMVLIPCGLPFVAIRLKNYVKTGENKPAKAEKWFVIAAFVLTVVFWIMRNTEAFSFLAPI